MRHLIKLGDGIDIAPVLAELDAQPELWDEHKHRTTIANGPFQQTSDLWVRFRDPGEISDPQKYAAPHFATWYPAFDRLPSLRGLIGNVMGLCAAAVRPGVLAHLGGVLITRIAAGAKILPHDDRGRWHAEFYNCKVYVPLRANEQCVNYCADEQAVMRPGEVWSFNNLVTHSVENNGDTERVILIVCMRVE